MTDLLDAAQRAHTAGLCVVPAASDGTKRPWTQWKEFQTHRPTLEDLAGWFGPNTHYTGFGAICGAVSGGLEMLEFEGRAVDEGVLAAFIDAAHASGAGDICDRIMTGYQERTPSGGVHWLYRCEEVTGNLKLAGRPPTAAELACDANDRTKVLIETRGEGGFVIVAPSNGTTHPTGASWELITGNFETIGTITAAERAELFALARSFDQMPAAKTVSVPPAKNRSPDAGLRPGDNYNARTTWAELLEPVGWRHSYTRDGIDYWCRPGKAAGTSATTNALGTDHLKVFSTSTAFDTDATYDRFGAYAVLEHKGDLAEASKALHARGYGTTSQPPETDRQRSEEQTPEDERRDLLRLALINSAHRAVDGATFLFDGSPQVAPLWGDGERCLWAAGESLIIAGPEGVGKTTLAQQLSLARCGIGPDELLSFPVVPDQRKVLYVAADRPSQARRSLLRMVDESDREALAAKLVVWRGPLPFDLVKQPELLVVLAEDHGAGTVVIDSLKDVAMDLAKDETGSRLNAAFQLALAEDIQVAALHHQRKAQVGASKPKTIADVYGSRWITAGAGSIFMVWGDPGDAVVELIHLKQPLEDIGPLQVSHDHHTGRSIVVDHVDVYQAVQDANKGTTAHAIAIIACKTVTPNKNQIEKARRRLEQLTREGRIHKQAGTSGGAGGGEQSLYFPLDRRH